MLTPPDFSEKLYNQTKRINLLEGAPRDLPSEIEIPQEQLAASKWAEMIQQTQGDNVERGVVVSSNRGRIITSEIFTGNAGSISIPEFPHGRIKSLFPWVKELVLVHSHPKPEGELGHLKTTLFSNGDLRSFDNGTYTALVMIDPGGVHAMVRTRLGNKLLLPSYDIPAQSLQKAKNGSNKGMEAMIELARAIEPFGLRYYYSSNLNPTEEGQIALKDVRILKA